MTNVAIVMPILYTGRFTMFSVITNFYNKKPVDACVATTWISYRCVPCHP